MTDWISKIETFQIEAFISTEDAARLQFPAMAEVRFADTSSSMSRPVRGRLVRSSPASAGQGTAQDGVNVQIELSLKDLTASATDFASNDWTGTAQSIPGDPSAHIILSRLTQRPDSRSNMPPLLIT